MVIDYETCWLMVIRLNSPLVHFRGVTHGGGELADVHPALPVLLHVQRGGDEDNFAEHLTGGIHCHGHYLRPKILTNLRLIETKQKQ